MTTWQAWDVDGDVDIGRRWTFGRARVLPGIYTLARSMARRRSPACDVQHGSGTPPSSLPLPLLTAPHVGLEKGGAHVSGYDGLRVRVRVRACTYFRCRRDMR